MNSRLLLVSGLALLCGGLRSTVDAASPRPNLVFIYSDDQRWDALGVIQREQQEAARFPWLRTPHLDALANEGLRFRNAFVVNSLCSPGRACILTGRYSHANGIINNTTPFPEQATTFASELRKAGYATAYFGKWHMGQQRERPGFDEFASFVSQGRYQDCPFIVNGEMEETQGWVDDVSTDRAIDYLQRQNGEKPFFLWLAFKSPHGPRGGENLPDRLRDQYSGEQSHPALNMDIPAPFHGVPLRQGNRNQPSRPVERSGDVDYMRHISGVDENVGRFLKALEDRGLSDNTVVTFTSDNGYYLGEHGLGDKRSAYDESLRVPLLVRWPGHISPGTSDALVLNIDLAPTFLDLAGVPLPTEVQGRSLEPLLRGESLSDWRSAFLYEYFKEPRFGSPTVLAVRTQDAKLIVYPGHQEWTELFDLKSDPFETRNLISDSSSAALRTRLEEELQRVQKESNFSMPANVDNSEQGGR